MDNEAEGHNVEAEAEPVDPEQEEYERNIRVWEEENDDDHLWKSEGKQTMFSSEIDVEEMYNPLYHHGQSVKRGRRGTGQTQLLQMPLAQRLSSCRHRISRWKRQNRNNAEERIE
ncbi:hypothetical protein HID58_043271, partial [Brassica napus]